MLDTAIGHDPTIRTVFSDDRVYRYVWIKQIIPDNFRLCHFLMLNPSTADEYAPDPTIRRCMGFARQWDRGIVVVTNLFALRSTDPRGLYRTSDPIGPDNNRHILQCGLGAQHAICAWGNHGALGKRSAEVVEMLQEAGVLLAHLGLNRSGEPKHPLYLPGNSELARYPGGTPRNGSSK